MHKPKKSLGQNFLQDENLIAQIVSLAESHYPVLEIGPGTGALTKRLLEESFIVLAIELDHELAQVVQERFQHSTQFSLVEGDILRLNLPELLEERGLLASGYQVVANLPYYITAPILRLLLTLPNPPQKLVLMVQAEVAERLAAPAGALSILGVMAQYYARVEKKISVPRNAFFPVPKVDSMIIELSPYRKAQAEDRAFFKLVKIGFAARRKTLVNNLVSGLQYPRSEIEGALVALELPADVRAQVLTVTQWQQLARILGSQHQPAG